MGGFLPTLTGADSSCWAALERRADKFNQAQKTELVQSLMKELNADQQRELRQVLGETGLKPEMYSTLSPGLRSALQRLQRRATISQRRREAGGEGEPGWPMYLGLVLFVFVFLVFGY